jgi:gamma-glutamylcyclotransferase (GGCT)/AIG2-like uncharacterized protein YtfP
VTSGLSLSRGWDESRHLRIPAHHHGGGEFTKMATGRIGNAPSAMRHPSTGHSMDGTEAGDTFEELFRSKGAHFLEQHFGHPYVRIAGSEGARNVPLDFRLDNRYGGELKTLNIHAKNQRIAMATAAVQRKREAARKKGWSEIIVVQVVDQETGEVHVYVYEGFTSKRVHKMQHIGKYTYTQKDFRHAQQRTGHWDKRHRRAVAV